MSTHEAAHHEATRHEHEATRPEAARPAGRARPVRLDIGQVTLAGYSPGRRDHFARALQAQLAGHGAPEAAARQAAEAILNAVDARLRRSAGQVEKASGHAHG